MKQLTILMILIGFLLVSGNVSAQSRKKSKKVTSSQLDEWNAAHNGAKLSVKWTLMVGGINEDGFGVWCTLSSKAEPYDLKHKVHLFGIDIKRFLHTGANITVTGKTTGVDNMDGKVQLFATEIVNNDKE